MIRVTNVSEKYTPVTKYNEVRYRICFDKVDVYQENPETHEQEKVEGINTWSMHDYYAKPTTEQMQEDVKDMTIQRYINEGLTPPTREDIDVSAYVVDD